MFRKTLIGAALALGFNTVCWAEQAVESTVEGLFKNKAELAGKQVVIKGHVVKVNNNIMRRNFLHVQDGSGAEGTDDITVTSQQTANVGDTVTITGNLAADLDFGAGYTYPLLIEEASIEVAGK